MYKEFFGLTERPFAKTPDPRFLFESRQHREALARLEYAVEERDLTLLTGGIGCGKTTISRALIDRLDEDDYKIILMINPRLSPCQLLRSICRMSGADPKFFKTDLIEQINEELFRLYEQNKSLVLIIDEAQLIPQKSTFDEIRLLTNFQMDDTNLLTVIMIGQPEIKKRFSLPAYEALTQRIGIRYDLKPLNLEETDEYIRFRLSVAGRKELLFDKDAVEEIFKFSRGIPRLINTAATTCLIDAFGRDISAIGGESAKAVIRDLKEDNMG